MAVDDRTGGLMVLVEAGRGHGRLQLLDGLLPVGDAALEVLDAAAPDGLGALALAGPGLFLAPGGPVGLALLLRPGLRRGLPRLRAGLRCGEPDRLGGRLVISKTSTSSLETGTWLLLPITPVRVESLVRFSARVDRATTGS